MSLAASTVPFEEIRPAQEGYSAGRFTATRVFRVPYNRRFEFAIDLVGGYKNPGNVWSPAETYPGVNQCVVTGVSMQSDGVGPVKLAATLPTQTAMAWQYSVITATYGPYESSGSDPANPNVVVYRQITSDWADERTAVPQFGAVFVNNVAVAEANISVPFLMVTDTWLNAQRIPAAAYTMAGKVNSLPITLRGKVWGAEKIMYKGFSEDQQFTNFGASAIKIAYRFHAREVSWNKMLQKDGTWQDATFFGGNPIYEKVDLNQLANVF